MEGRYGGCMGGVEGTANKRGKELVTLTDSTAEWTKTITFALTP